MTAIAGFVDRESGRVWIGGDSAGVGGSHMETRTDPKVFRNGEAVIGYTSSFRMGQILEHHFSLPVPYEGEGGMAYMVRRFVPAVKSALSDHGFATKRDGEDRGGTFLVGYRGELYEVEGDYQVARIAHDYHACGCGYHLSLGAFHALSPYDVSPRVRVTAALEAAEEFSSGVRRPFTIVSTKV